MIIEKPKNLFICGSCGSGEYYLDKTDKCPKCGTRHENARNNPVKIESIVIMEKEERDKKLKEMMNYGARPKEVKMKNYEMYSKIVGTTFVENSKKVINSLNKGESLTLKREPENPHDVFAIMVLKDNKIGYLPRQTAESVAPLMDRNITVTCTVSEITGLDKENQGCNILLQWNL